MALDDANHPSARLIVSNVYLGLSNTSTGLMIYRIGSSGVTKHGHNLALIGGGSGVLDLEEPQSSSTLIVSSINGSAR